MRVKARAVLVQRQLYRPFPLAFYPVRDAQKRGWIRDSIRDCTFIISTAASFFTTVVAQICRLPNMQMRAKSRTPAREKSSQVVCSAIADGKKDPSGFSQITDGITKAKTRHAVETALYTAGAINLVDVRSQC